MKKAIFIIATVLVLFTGFFHHPEGGNVDSVKVVPIESELYSELDYNEAVKSLKLYFKESMKGCVLQEVSYAGDEKIGKAEIEDEETMILLAQFKTDETADSPLAQNTTYKNSSWTFSRENDGKWKFVSHK